MSVIKQVETFGYWKMNLPLVNGLKWKSAKAQSGARYRKGRLGYPLIRLPGDVEMSPLQARRDHQGFHQIPRDLPCAFGGSFLMGNNARDNYFSP